MSLSHLFRDRTKMNYWNRDRVGNRNPRDNAKSTLSIWIYWANFSRASTMPNLSQVWCVFKYLLCIDIADPWLWSEQRFGNLPIFPMGGAVPHKLCPFHLPFEGSITQPPKVLVIDQPRLCLFSNMVSKAGPSGVLGTRFITSPYRIKLDVALTP